MRYNKCLTFTFTFFVVDTAAESADVGQQSDDDGKKYLQLDEEERRHFVTQLSDVFWHLYDSRPVNVLTAPAGMPGTIPDLVMII